MADTEFVTGQQDPCILYWSWHKQANAVSKQLKSLLNFLKQRKTIVWHMCNHDILFIFWISRSANREKIACPIITMTVFFRSLSVK